MSGITHSETDVRNSERLVEKFGSDLRFVGAWGKWLVWDERRWLVDTSGRVMRRAVATVRVMLAEALEAHSVAAQDYAAAGGENASPEIKATFERAKRAISWAIRSQSAPRIDAMLKLAKSAPEVAITHDKLDADPMLLNVENGTIDLRTGKRRVHDRDDLMTKIAPVCFDPRAKCPTWDAFIDRAMAGSPELVGFLRRVTGYAMTGSIREHALVFFFGDGANGKSTFLGTVHALLGDYARPAPRGLLFKSKTERHPTELASLFGARFVTCSEIEAGQSFDEALVKDLTGGDAISARKMHEDFWSFLPTHKFFLYGNHKPTVRGDDDGIWRRIRLVPWTVKTALEDQDKELPPKLRAELPGILAWAVRGCLEWQRDGLGEPVEVREATEKYRVESDALGEFFELRCVFDVEATVPRKMLRQSYEDYAKENGVRSPMGARAFGEKLRKHGVTDTSVRSMAKVVDGWRGVRLRTEEDPRRDVGTVGTNLRLIVETSRPRRDKPENDPRTHYVPTEGDEGFADWLKREGVAE